MNCYYSNLIEGHDTRPKDIERALGRVPSLIPERRPLALEARAHVLVHRAIDEAYAAGRLLTPTSIPFIMWIHRSFYEEMPEEFRIARGRDGEVIPILPGQFRTQVTEDVEVGRHVPPSSAHVADFMAHFERRFAMADQWASTRVIRRRFGSLSSQLHPPFP
jgi:Fic family protein